MTIKRLCFILNYVRTRIRCVPLNAVVNKFVNSPIFKQIYWQTQYAHSRRNFRKICHSWWSIACPFPSCLHIFRLLYYPYQQRPIIRSNTVTMYHTKQIPLFRSTKMRLRRTRWMFITNRCLTCWHSCCKILYAFW